MGLAHAISALSLAVAPYLSGTPYADPPFGGQCVWHHFAEGETPPLWLYLLDPLCVEYQKRDITFDNGGALEFLLAEPARIAVSIPSCRYWQKDHWSIQPTAGATPIVAWDGSYWFDRKARVLSARLSNFTVHGHTAGTGDVVQALRPYAPRLADVLAAYGEQAGETGLRVSLPYDLRCSLRGDRP